MFLSSARPFYNSTDQLVLQAISPKEYIPFVCHWFEAYEKSISSESVQWAYDYLEGNTYCMQKLFHEAFANTSEGEDCSLESLKKTLENILVENGAGYRKILSRIPERQKEVLYAIAREGRAQKVMSAAFIRKYSLSTTSSVQAAIKKLLADGIISVEDYVYFVPDIYFRLFICHFM
jgi:hypothetical protein